MPPKEEKPFDWEFNRVLQYRKKMLWRQDVLESIRKGMADELDCVTVSLTSDQADEIRNAGYTVEIQMIPNSWIHDFKYPWTIKFLK